MTDDMVRAIEAADRFLARAESALLWGALFVVVAVPAWLVRGLI